MAQRNVKQLVGWLLGLVIVAGLVVGGYFLFKPDPLIPSAVRKDISIIIYMPTSPWIVTSKDISYISSAGVLTIHAKNGPDMLTITEQAAPSQFTDIPQYFPALLNKLNSYESFGSTSGTVYLTKPTELKGGIEAVMSSNGTLLFAYPSQSMSDSDWRNFFNNLQVLK